MTWFELVKRRKQRLEYIRQYARYRYHGGWRRFHSTKEKASRANGDVVVAQLEAMEGKLPIDMAIRYRALSRAVGNRLEASLGNKWWEVFSPKEMAVGRAAPAIDKAARRRRERQKAEGFHFFGLHFGGSSAPKKEEEEEPRHGGGGGGGGGGVDAAAAADDNDDDAEDDSSLRRRVRARWSIAGIMSEWQLQRLQEDLANGDEVLPSSSSSDTT